MCSTLWQNCVLICWCGMHRCHSMPTQFIQDLEGFSSNLSSSTNFQLNDLKFSFVFWSLLIKAWVKQDEPRNKFARDTETKLRLSTYLKTGIHYSYSMLVWLTITAWKKNIITSKPRAKFTVFFSPHPNAQPNDIWVTGRSPAVKVVKFQETMGLPQNRGKLGGNDEIWHVFVCWNFVGCEKMPNKNKCPFHKCQRNNKNHICIKLKVYSQRVFFVVW